MLASTQDIQANTPLDPLIAQGVFQTIQVAERRRSFPDAVTDVSQLQGQTATAPIYQNEQIPMARTLRAAPRTSWVSTKATSASGLRSTGQAAVNGYVQQGDHITIYATFHRGTLVTKQTLRFCSRPRS